MIGTRIIQTRLMPDGRIAAITLFGLVFTRDKRYIDHRLLTHELIHCQQQLEWLYLTFYIIYIVEWLWYLVRYRDATKAYHQISFEREAYQNDGDENYPRRRRHYANFRL